VDCLELSRIRISLRRDNQGSHRKKMQSELSMIKFQTQEKQQLLEKINKYLVCEDFPKEHLTALLKLICRFNENKEIELKIFNFIDEIIKRDKES
jgi:hypothetical protein